MDVLRHCRTNVQICEDIENIPFAVYQRPQGGQDQCGWLQKLVATLRATGSLCAKVDNELWVFGNVSKEAGTALEGLSVRVEHTEEGEFETGIVEAADGSQAREIVLAAIQGSITFKLAQSCGVLRVGDWTWLCPGGGEDEQPGAILLKLHLKMNENRGLYAITTTEESHLSTLSLASQAKATVKLAPSGLVASVLEASDDDPDLISGDAWKAMVATELAMDCVEIPDQAVWVPVALLRGDIPTKFTWPAQLCLSYRDQRQRRGLDIADAEWKHLFIPPEHIDGFKHPLTFAEEWFSGKDDREKALGQTAAPMLDSGLGLEEGTIATAGSEMEGVVARSSPFIQRLADQHTAMAGIYPTPEDNLMPSNASQQPQQHQQTDHPATTNPTDAHVTGADTISGGDTQDALRHTSISNGPVLQHMHDDLFEDIGNDMGFGGGEVGDADFDFFNEDIEAAPENAIEDVPMNDDAQENVAAHIAMDRSQQDSTAPIGTERLGGDHQSDVRSYGDETVPLAQSAILDHAADADQQSSLPVADDQAQEQPVQEPEKPLSPFGIRERLLPPPIPASAKAPANNGIGHQNRRSSAFDPVTFRDGLDLFSRYTHPLNRNPPHDRDAGSRNDISLPPKRKKSKPKERSEDMLSDVSESEEDSFTTATSMSEDEVMPKLLWHPNKRKRDDAYGLASGDDDCLWSQEENATVTRGATEEMADMLKYLSCGRSFPAASDDGDSAARNATSMISTASHGLELTVPAIQDSGDLSKLDVVYIAQLASEQAISCLPTMVQELDTTIARSNEESFAASTALQQIVEQLLSMSVPGTAACNISNLAMIRDAQSARAPSSQPSRPGLPRPPPQRNEAAAPGPDLLPIAPPYIRVQRGHDKYEMLPPALGFWEPLSLAPCNGPKNIRAFCVYPNNEDLRRLMDMFMSELGGVYESCKLGSHVHIRNVNDDDELDDFEDGLAAVSLDEEAPVTLEAALRAYQVTCTELGTFLANVGHLEGERDRTMVIYLLDVFPQHPRILHHLSACFWLLYKAYRDNLPKAARSVQRCDIVLQILPVGLVASADTLICLDSKQLGALAKEVYDRCPPCFNHELHSALPNYAAPFVELAAPPPKRIGFQLSAEPPSDLLHEASSLHVAYAISADEQWLTVSWVDNTGRYSSIASFCLRGKMFEEVIEDVWDRTRDILAARGVSWRVIIVTTSRVEESIKMCWRKTIEKPRKQPYSVTLLTADLDPKLRLSAPNQSNSSDDPAASSGAAFLTPVSTPSAQNITTVTPEASTQTSNAPPTPAPSDSFANAAAALDADPDAHLVDLTDESLGILFNTSYSSVTASSSGTLASGALIKRGNGASRHLESMRLDLLWTVQVRPNGTVDEGGARHAEMTLREVVRAYRALSVLTRAKGLDGSGSGGAQRLAVAPLHLRLCYCGLKDKNFAVCSSNLFFLDRSDFLLTLNHHHPPPPTNQPTLNVAAPSPPQSRITTTITTTIITIIITTIITTMTQVILIVAGTLAALVANIFLAFIALYFLSLDLNGPVRPQRHQVPAITASPPSPPSPLLPGRSSVDASKGAGHPMMRREWDWEKRERQRADARAVRRQQAAIEAARLDQARRQTSAFRQPLLLRPALTINRPRVAVTTAAAPPAAVKPTPKPVTGDGKVKLTANGSLFPRGFAICQVRHAEIDSQRRENALWLSRGFTILLRAV
ncbi:Component of the SRB8-11 complex, partial [Teratosphaeria destructans]